MLSGVWDHLEEGAISTVNPQSAQSGVNVTISGSEMFGHSTSVSTVTAGGVDVTSELVVTSKHKLFSQFPAPQIIGK